MGRVACCEINWINILTWLAWSKKRRAPFNVPSFLSLSLPLSLAFYYCARVNRRNWKIKNALKMLRDLRAIWQVHSTWLTLPKNCVYFSLSRDPPRRPDVKSHITGALRKKWFKNFSGNCSTGLSRSEFARICKYHSAWLRSSLRLIYYMLKIYPSVAQIRANHAANWNLNRA